MLLYLIWLFNYKPLADCRSSGSRLERTLHIFPVKALSKSPPHVASLAEPRATREISGPSSCRYPALTDASVLTMPPAVVVRQSLVSGSAIPHVNSFLSGHVSPPHAPLASTEHRPSFHLNQCELAVWYKAESILILQHLSPTNRFRALVHSSCVWSGTWLLKCWKLA